MTNPYPYKITVKCADETVVDQLEEWLDSYPCKYKWSGLYCWNRIEITLGFEKEEDKIWCQLHWS